MKHHIDSIELKKFKKFLWNLRSKVVSIEFRFNGQLESDGSINSIQLLNYGLVQTDRDGHVISSNDNSYQSYYRREAEKDPVKYFILTIDCNGRSQEKYFITSNELTFESTEHSLILNWLDTKSNTKSITISSSEVQMTNKPTNSKWFKQYTDGRTNPEDYWTGKKKRLFEAGLDPFGKDPKHEASKERRRLAREKKHIDNRNRTIKLREISKDRYKSDPIYKVWYDAKKKARELRKIGFKTNWIKILEEEGKSDYIDKIKQMKAEFKPTLLEMGVKIKSKK